MKKLIIGIISLTFISGCTTEYLKDSNDSERTIGYEGKTEGKSLEYKDIKRKKVTVANPLIENINEDVPDLVALPVEKVAVVELPSEKSVVLEVAGEENASGESVIIAEEQSHVSEEAKALDLVINDIINGPEEKVTLLDTPPLSPIIVNADATPSDEIVGEIDEGYSNILSLINVISFKPNVSRLGNDDYDIAKEVAEIQKEDGGRVKIIVYTPEKHSKDALSIYKARKNNIMKAINKFGVKKTMIVSEIEKTKVKDLFDTVEIYIEY